MPGYTFDVPQFFPDECVFSEAPTDLPTDDHAPISLHTSTFNQQPAAAVVTLRMPTPLIARLDKLAERSGTSRSHILRQLTSLVLDSIQDDSDLDRYDMQLAALYQRACELIWKEGQVSTALLQRYLRVDYHVALLLIDQLQKTHVVTVPDDNGRILPTRQYLVEYGKFKKRAES